MTKNSKAKQMNFDKWLDLAMNDPDGFESARTAAIQGFLESTPKHSRQRLSGLQWRIDMIRQRSKTPMAACQAIYSMMWDQLAGDEGMIESLKSMANGTFNAPEPKYNARILPFRSRLDDEGELS